MVLSHSGIWVIWDMGMLIPVIFDLSCPYALAEVARGVHAFLAPVPAYTGILAQFIVVLASVVAIAGPLHFSNSSVCDRGTQSGLRTDFT